MLTINLVQSFALALAAASSVSTASLQPRQAPAAWSDFTKNPVFYPGRSWPSWRTLYARTLQLADKSILLSWEDYDNGVADDQAYFPIHRSTDGGATFANMTRVYDQVNGWGNRYQPFLFTLPQDMGGLPAGTILLAGTSTPANLSAAYIDLYASGDQGHSWKFLSHIAYGSGREIVDNGNSAIWEPFLMVYEDQLVCFYSTQTDPKHAQKLVHVTTKDLKSWSAEVEDEAQTKYTDRPGMTTVAYSPVSGKYVMTFEYCQDGVGCPVYFKVAESPLAFGPETPLPLVGTNNPQGSPYIIWTESPEGDGSGVFIANGNSREEVFVNDDAVDPSGWKAVNINHWSAYSRSLRIIDTPQDSKKLLVANGGNIGCSGSCYNYVVDAVVDIPTYPHSGSTASSSTSSRSSTSSSLSSTRSLSQTSTASSNTMSSQSASSTLPTSTAAACSALPSSPYKHVSTDSSGKDTAASFLADTEYSKAANNAVTPSTYTSVFVNKFSSVGTAASKGYLGYSSYATYDPKICADACAAKKGCRSFNVFFERDPVSRPCDSNPNPGSQTTIKCTFWNLPIAAANATNSGQWRRNFQVVIAGSNGYTLS